MTEVMQFVLFATVRCAWEGRTETLVSPDTGQDRWERRTGWFRRTSGHIFIGSRSCVVSLAGKLAGRSSIKIFMSSRTLGTGLPVLAVLPSLLITCGAFAQSAETPSLPQVLVTATRYEQDPQSTPAYLTVITRDQMDSANVLTVNEAISRIGGLATRTSLTGGNELTVDPMGFGDTAGANLLVLIDGIPLREGDATEIRLSSLPVESVERIEIQRSSGGVLYGGGSTGGVVNIITRASAGKGKDGTSASVYAGRGSFSTDEYRVNARYAKGGLDLSLAASDRSSEGFRQHSANSDRGLFFSGSYTGQHARAGLSLSTGDTFAQTPGSLTEQEYRTDRRLAQPASLANDTRIQIDTTRTAAFVESEFGGTVWRLDASTRRRNLDAVAVQGGFRSAFEYRGDDQFFGLSGQRIDATPLGRSRLVFGVERGDWSQLRVYPPPLTFGNYQLDFRSTGYFIKDDLDIERLGLRLTAGYRREQNERSQLGLRFGDSVENRFTRSAWELGAAKQLSPADTLYARIATSFRFANIDEIGSSYDTSYNPMTLRPQTSKDYEAGWKRALGQRGRIDFRVYRSDLTNELAYSNLGLDAFGYLVGSNLNLEPTRRQGTDLNLTYQLTGKLLVGSSLSVRDARFRSGEFEGKRVPMSAGQVVSVRGEYSFNDRQKFGAMARWTSSQYVAMDFENRYRMPSYAVADLYYQYRVGNLELSLKALNIFDRSYYSYATRAQDPAASQPFAPSLYTAVYPDAGRSLWVSARMRF